MGSARCDFVQNGPCYYTVVIIFFTCSLCSTPMLLQVGAPRKRLTARKQIGEGDVSMRLS